MINHTAKTKDCLYYISSIDYTDIEIIAKSIRSHLQVENNLHWVLDVTFKEDTSRIRDTITTENMSWIRKMAVGLLKKNTGKMPMKNKMLLNCINPDKDYNLLFF